MCLAIYKPAGVVVGRKRLSTAFRSNPHGAGFGFVDDEGKLMYAKGYFTFDDFLKAYRTYVHAHTPAVIHFRWATVGGKTPENCHPFPAAGGLLIHNGPQIQQLRDSVNDRSDSRIFAEDILAGLNKEMLERMKPVIEGYLQANKVAVLHADGSCTLFNEKGGAWHEGAWYSNDGWRSTSWRARRARDAARSSGNFQGSSGYNGYSGGGYSGGRYPGSQYPNGNAGGYGYQGGYHSYGVHGSSRYPYDDDDYDLGYGSYDRSTGLPTSQHHHLVPQSRYSDPSPTSKALAERFTKSEEGSTNGGQASGVGAKQETTQVVTSLADVVSQRQKQARQEADRILRLPRPSGRGRQRDEKGRFLPKQADAVEPASLIVPPTEAELIKLCGPDAADYIRQYVDVEDWIYSEEANLFFFLDITQQDYIDVETSLTYSEYLKAMYGSGSDDWEMRLDEALAGEPPAPTARDRIITSKMLKDMRASEDRRAAREDLQRRIDAMQDAAAAAGQHSPYNGMAGLSTPVTLQ